MAKQPEGLRVTIVRRTPIEIAPKPGAVETQYAISYIAEGLPLRTIFMMAKEWTAEK